MKFELFSLIDYSKIYSMISLGNLCYNCLDCVLGAALMISIRVRRGYTVKQGPIEHGNSHSVSLGSLQCCGSKNQLAISYNLVNFTLCIFVVAL